MANLDDLAVRPLRSVEKSNGMPGRFVRNAAATMFARLPSAEARLENAMARALNQSGPDGLWFTLSCASAEFSLRDRLTISVDPARIKFWLLSQASINGGVVQPRDYFLGGGDWSPLIAPLRSSGLDREARELAHCKGEVAGLKAYRELARSLKKAGGSMFYNGYAIENEDGIRGYLEHHVAVVENIRAYGLLARGDMQRLPPMRSSRPPSLEKKEFDAGAAIGADGELLRYRGGFHRTAFAQELGLKSMPVAVRLVHVDWLRKLVDDTGLSPIPALLAGLDRIAAG